LGNNREAAAKKNQNNRELVSSQLIATSKAI
jgi:hypothetical protein